MRNPLWTPKQTINCRGKLIYLDPPAIIGILNLTPDSFFEESRLNGLAPLMDRAGTMIKEGATILDVGGFSSRPGAAAISASEEIDRILPAIESLAKYFPDTPISVDTYRMEVAEAAVKSGASIINDISAGSMDAALWPWLSKVKVPYILMHMQGTPDTMQLNPVYEDVVAEVLDFFIQKTFELRKLGVLDIILDPGFGFGKTVRDNYRLLTHLHVFKSLGLPIMTGVSRKSMINSPLAIKPKDALNGTSVLHYEALCQGSTLFRVHDVKEVREVIQLWSIIEENRSYERSPEGN
jgi:dihydropteroate synthase